MADTKRDELRTAVAKIIDYRWQLPAKGWPNNYEPVIDAYTRADAILALLEPGWRADMENAKSGDRVLVYWEPHDGVHVARWMDLDDGDGFNWYTDSLDYLPTSQITRWMPLPDTKSGERDG